MIIIIIIIIIIILKCKRQLENIIVDNYEDTMMKTGAMLHFGIMAAGEIVCKFRHAQYSSPLKTI